MATIEKKVVCLEGDLASIERRIEAMEEHLEGTPALGLRKWFKCDCGTTGFVAIRVKCTKCGKEDWWGWFPKQ